MVTSGVGRLLAWFTDARSVGREPVEQDSPGVYRIDPDGSDGRLLGALGRTVDRRPGLG